MIRLVKMTFEPDKTAEFEALFEQVKNQIRNFPGCLRVDLLNDLDRSNVYFTYSIWEDDMSLQNYRNSDLFEDTWAKTKALFKAPAEAWSTDVMASGESVD